jgi:hypothetical protein
MIIWEFAADDEREALAAERDIRKRWVVPGRMVGPAGLLFLRPGNQRDPSVPRPKWDKEDKMKTT